MNSLHIKTTAERSASVVLAAASGLEGAFAALYFSILPIFLKPVASEFGLGRTQTTAVTVAAMLGMAARTVLMGRLLVAHQGGRVRTVKVKRQQTAREDTQ